MRVDLKCFHHTEEMASMWFKMLVNAMVVIILQYASLTNHIDTIDMFYVNYISMKLKRGKNRQADIPDSRMLLFYMIPAGMEIWELSIISKMLSQI